MYSETYFEKVCKKCNKIKQLSAFYEHSASKDGYCNKCKECILKERKEAYPYRNKEKRNAQELERYHADKTKFRRNFRKYRYGITDEQYNKLLEEQKGCCAICKEPGKLVIDHCHKTGGIRGLLHAKCNSAIGMLGDDINKVISAASYLTRRPGL